MSLSSIPSWARVVLVLPTAVAALIGGQLFVLFLSFLNGLALNVHSWEYKWLMIATKFLSAVIPPYCAVSLGSTVAPCRQPFVAVLLGILYAALEIVVIGLYLTQEPGSLSDPLWWVVAAALLGVAAAILAILDCFENVSHVSE